MPPLLGLRRGFDRCYGSFDCLIDGLTNSGLVKRGSSQACGEPKMEVNEPIRLRVRVRNWWPTMVVASAAASDAWDTSRRGRRRHAQDQVRSDQRARLFG